MTSSSIYNSPVQVNFGQMPFLYDTSQLPSTVMDQEEVEVHSSSRTAFSFASESVSLLRHLLGKKNWREHMLQIMTNVINSTPSVVRTMALPIPLPIAT